MLHRLLPKEIAGYADFEAKLKVLSPVEARETLRWMGRNDLYFLLRYLMGRKDMEHVWLFDRCREVQEKPDGHLDLWARDHYKSTIITTGLTIQDVLNAPDEVSCVLSYNRVTAKSFLVQIMREFEQNELLKALYSDVLYRDPKKESPKWSADEGIVVKRGNNPKECTLEAFGLIDGQPTGKHYNKLIYDDVVTLEACTTPESLKKVTAAWEMSLNLGSGESTRKRYIGTRYHVADTWGEIVKRGAAIPRIRHAERDGVPVFRSRAYLDEKRRDMGPYVYASQMMLNPLAEGVQTFLPQWLKYYAEPPEQVGKYCNIAILVDPATSKNKGADSTAIWVVGWSDDGNRYVLDGLKGKLNLVERTAAVFRFHRKWSKVSQSRVKVGYEKYGAQSDIEHIEAEMKAQSYRFSIITLAGNVAKKERIEKLIPLFEQERLWLPLDAQGELGAAVKSFVNDEYLFYPVCRHEDGLDCLARVEDNSLSMQFPKSRRKGKEPENDYRTKERVPKGSWMSL